MSKISIIKDAAEKAIAAEKYRGERLCNRAEKCVAGIIVIAGFQLLNASNVLLSDTARIETLFYSALTALAISLFFGFYSMRLVGCPDYPRGHKLWEILKPENVSEDAAEEALVQMLLKNREQIAKINDTKARSLSVCTWLLFAGFLLVIASQLFAPYAYISPPQ